VWFGKFFSKLRRLQLTVVHLNDLHSKTMAPFPVGRLLPPCPSAQAMRRLTAPAAARQGESGHRFRKKITILSNDGLFILIHFYR
jgi:hypothetical protein